jgi:hypothetical protein
VIFKHDFLQIIHPLIWDLTLSSTFFQILRHSQITKHHYSIVFIFQVLHSKNSHPLRPAVITIRRVDRAFTESDLSSAASSSSDSEEICSTNNETAEKSASDPPCQVEDSLVTMAGDEDGDGLTSHDLYRCGNQVSTIKTYFH